MANNYNMPPQQQRPQIQIKIADEQLKGAYTNSVAVFHSKEEFVLDFMNVYPPQGMGTVVSRVITSPGHMKRLLAALQDNIAKYEKQHGKIEEAKTPDASFGFNTEEKDK
ncbi:MAG: DUF3467 domain-containing protein [Candidatus Nomurabacteria bacterium]|nr:MAG: DUF3467 domain-containing protein [Candidatus Nomurabacteria bacterium]